MCLDKVKSITTEEKRAKERFFGSTLIKVRWTICGNR